LPLKSHQKTVGDLCRVKQTLPKLPSKRLFTPNISFLAN
jgi:hypothetical protein